ncbi:MAG TPA: metal ABC transporter permease [Vicinamibacterales bacterium]|nr:metal ABC transporter permease [Vicinamibacterales bacterium]
MMELLSYEFGQRALAAGVIVGLMCAVLAFFVVLRRMAFVGVGLSHAALGGVALGVITGTSPLAGAMTVSLVVAWVIGWLTRRGRLTEDTAIGVLFPTAMAFGIALMSLSATYRQDLIAYLFGSILAIRTADLQLLIVLAAATLSLLALFFKELVFMSVDEEAASAARLPVTTLRYLLLTVLAATIVASIKLVGVVLVSALLVVPAATGQLAARSMKSMLVVSVMAAEISVIAGLWLSWTWNLPSGSTIVLVSATLFLVAFVSRRRADGAP